VRETTSASPRSRQRTGRRGQLSSAFAVPSTESQNAQDLPLREFPAIVGRAVPTAPSLAARWARRSRHASVRPPGYGLTIALSGVIGGASGLVLLPKAIRDFRL
jgi:hypothetical protein